MFSLALSFVSCTFNFGIGGTSNTYKFDGLVIAKQSLPTIKTIEGKPPYSVEEIEHINFLSPQLTL